MSRWDLWQRIACGNFITGTHSIELRNELATYKESWWAWYAAISFIVSRATGWRGWEHQMAMRTRGHCHPHGSAWKDVLQKSTLEPASASKCPQHHGLLSSLHVAPLLPLAALLLLEGDPIWNDVLLHFVKASPPLCDFHSQLRPSVPYHQLFVYLHPPDDDVTTDHQNASVPPFSSALEYAADPSPSCAIPLPQIVSALRLFGALLHAAPSPTSLALHAQLIADAQLLLPACVGATENPHPASAHPPSLLRVDAIYLSASTLVLAVQR